MYGIILAITVGLTSPLNGWKHVEGEYWALWKNGEQIGGYLQEKQVFREWKDGKWGQATEPPWAQFPMIEDCGPGCKLLNGEKNYGLDRTRIDGTGERFSLGGESVCREKALAAIGGNIPDDAKKLRLTLIGSDADRKKVLSDFAADPALSALKPNLVIQDYPAPDGTGPSAGRWDPAWATRVGFVTAGTPSIYLQSPEGKVLVRKATYDGPADLAGAIRRADPAYEPKKDPDGSPKLPAGPGNVPLPAWLIAVLVGLGLIAKTKGEK